MKQQPQRFCGDRATHWERHDFTEAIVATPKHKGTRYGLFQVSTGKMLAYGPRYVLERSQEEWWFPTEVRPR